MNTFVGASSVHKKVIKDLIKDRLEGMLKVTKPLSDKGFKTIWTGGQSSYER